MVTFPTFLSSRLQSAALDETAFRPSVRPSVLSAYAHISRTVRLTFAANYGTLAGNPVPEIELAWLS